MFRIGLPLLPLVCHKLLRYVNLEINCVAAYCVLVRVDYGLNIVVCSDVSNEFIFGVLYCDIVFFGFFGSDFN